MDLQGKNVICYVRCYGYQKLYKELSELIVYCSTHGGNFYDPCFFYDLDSESDELRPGLDAITTLSRYENIDVILVYSYHRIHMDFEKYQHLERGFNKNGVIIHSINKEVEMGLLNDI